MFPQSMQIDQLIVPAAKLFSRRTGTKTLFRNQNPDTNSDSKKNTKNSKRIKNFQNINIIHNFPFCPANNQERYKYSITFNNPLIKTNITPETDVVALKAGVTKAAINEALAISRKKSDSNPDSFESNFINFHFITP